ncbi:MAG: hypothetical protein IJ424_08040 [Oscillospiraceae bacterium]|nr:hypothetical protein [Oscillospiraceae bacterium]
MNKIKLTLLLPSGKISTVCETLDEVCRCISIINTFCDEIGLPRPNKLTEEVSQNVN